MINHTNRLIESTSPYLLQHSHNPVDWYPWSQEALDLSKKKNIPILLSIGYSACHWCHVMERESFENETTANIMNSNFINIKVDREERPDIDESYMAATQAMNKGQGGWPMTVKLKYSLKNLIDNLKLPIKKIAIELNRQIVDKKRISKIILKSGDNIEIVNFIGGG